MRLWINKILEPGTKLFQEDLKQGKDLLLRFRRKSKSGRTVMYMQPKMVSQFYDSVG